MPPVNSVKLRLLEANSSGRFDLKSPAPAEYIKNKIFPWFEFTLENFLNTSLNARGRSLFSQLAQIQYLSLVPQRTKSSMLAIINKALNSPGYKILCYRKNQ